MGVKRLREYPLNRDSIITGASLDRSDEANDHFFPLTTSLGSGNMFTVRKIGQTAVCGGGGRLSCDVLSPHPGGIDMLFVAMET